LVQKKTPAKKQPTREPFVKKTKLIIRERREKTKNKARKGRKKQINKRKSNSKYLK
jgi:hypothetical protein